MKLSLAGIKIETDEPLVVTPMRRLGISLGWRLCFGLAWTPGSEMALMHSYGFITIWLGPLAVSIHFPKPELPAHESVREAREEWDKW